MALLKEGCIGGEGFVFAVKLAVWDVLWTHFGYVSQILDNNGEFYLWIFFALGCLGFCAVRIRQTLEDRVQCASWGLLVLG